MILFVYHHHMMHYTPHIDSMNLHKVLEAEGVVILKQPLEQPLEQLLEQEHPQLEKSLEKSHSQWDP
jgi:hypothetical protein